jgi:membrane fusion protein, heavy metal efflux system
MKIDQPTRIRAATMGLLVTSFALLAACGDSAPAKTETAVMAVDPTVVNIDPSQAVNFKTAPVQWAMVASTQTHPGRIEANERLVSRIGAGATGRITKVSVELGDRVNSGQLLAEISSPEITASQLAFLRANAALALAERGVERARQMIQADVISTAEFQRRESELSIARAERRSAEDQLRLLGLTSQSIERLRDEGRIQPEGGVHSKQFGTIIERKVSVGQVVQPGDQLFTVADLSSVWAVGSLPEQTAQSVKKNQMVAIEIPGIEKTFKGRIVFISDTVQPETRTVAIRTQLDNPDREIKPQMLVNMRIAATPKKLPVIPESAVVRDQDKDHVFVQTQAHTFKLTPVKLDAATDKIRPVLGGLEVGSVVVVDGGFHLNNDRLQRLLTQQQSNKNSGASK